MGIEDKLIQLGETKNSIKNAIIEKGGVVNDSTPFGDYAQAIRNISGGGGGETKKPILRLNWELQPHDENYYGNTGFITGTCLTGCYSSNYTPPKLVYTMSNVPSSITSAKLIICTGQVRYANSDFWAITGGVNDNQGHEIECLANGTSEFGAYNRYSGVDTYTAYKLCSSLASPTAIGGQSLNWQTIEFDGTTNHIRCYKQETGAMNATNELFPLITNLSPAEDIDAGQFTGINGSFIGEGFRVVLNNDVADNSWKRGFNGNIDLLHTCLIINDEVVSSAMEIVLQ